MATIQQEITIAKERAAVWDAVRDVGNIDKRLVRGFVVECRLDGNKRTIRFANGLVVDELIVTVDDDTFRHAWSARGEALEHHNASLQLFDDGEGRCRATWIADFLPDTVGDQMDAMISQGLLAMKRTLETG